MAGNHCGPYAAPCGQKIESGAAFASPVNYRICFNNRGLCNHRLAPFLLFEHICILVGHVRGQYNDIFRLYVRIQT